MLYDEFKAMVKRLNQYYGLKANVSIGRFEQWYSKVKWIPSAAIKHIEASIQDNWNTLPANIPKHMHIYYHAWKSANAKKIIAYPKTDCDQCHGIGLLWAKRIAKINGEIIKTKDGIMMEEISFRCGACENFKRHVSGNYPMATIEQLIEQGYKPTM